MFVFPTASDLSFLKVHSVQLLRQDNYQFLTIETNVLTA